MNIVLWILQALLAAHTAMGAVWKFSHSEQSVPTLQAIPHGVWLGMSVFELLCALALLVPTLSQPLGILAPIAAAGIGAEMLAMCGVHLRSGATKHQPMVYWLVVAGFCAVVAYGRFVLSPF